MRKLVRISILVLFALASGTACAKTNDTKAVTAKIKKLETKIKQLEKKVDDLSGLKGYVVGGYYITTNTKAVKCVAFGNAKCSARPYHIDKHKCLTGKKIRLDNLTLCVNK